MRNSSSSYIVVQWIIHWLGLLILGTVIAGNLFLDYGRIENREKEHLLLQTLIVQKILDHNLLAIDAVLQDLREHAVQAESPVSLNHRLDILATALGGVRTLTLFDKQGVVLASNKPELIGKDFSTRNYFQHILQDHNPDTLYVSSPFKTSLGAFTMTVGRMVIGADGAFAGVVNVSLDPDFFKPLLGSTLYTSDMWMNLVHGDGTVFLMLPDRDGVVGNTLARPGTLFTRHRESGRETSVFVDTVYATGETRMLAARTIQPPGLRMSAPLVVGISRDLDRLFEDWRKDAYLAGGLLAVLALLSTLFLNTFHKRQRENARQLAKTTQALAERERFIRMVTDNIPAMVAYWNADLRCEYANNVYLAWFGRSSEQMLGISIQELMGEALFSRNEHYIRGALRGEPQTFERNLTKTDGSMGYTLAQYIPDLVDGVVRGFFVLVADVTDLKNTQLELERKVLELDLLATTDPLTGIGNRRRFFERATEELAQSKRYGFPLAILMIDVDHFKAVNDTYGHDIGDEVLKALAVVLKEALRTTDQAGRLGGEEFGALLTQTGQDEAKVVAQRVRVALRETCVRSGTAEVRFTVSIGLAACSDDVDSVEELLKRADLALYHAKETGRDRVCCHGEF